MKKLMLLLLFAISLPAVAQISMRVDKKELLDKFRSTETIFVLSNAYDSKAYEEILKQSWTVTPYRVIRLNDFNPEEFIDDKHSFVTLDIFQIFSKSDVYLSASIGIYMFDVEKKLKEIEKMKKASEKKKAEWEITQDNRIIFGSILLSANAEFKYAKSVKKAGEKMYEEKVFNNDNPGFLKNYFQEMNALLSSGKTMNYSGGWCTPGITELKNKVLYVPKYALTKFNKWKSIDEKLTLEEQNNLFKNYSHKYEFMDSEEIGRKIVAGEDFYYMRFLTSRGQKHVQVVHSTDGEIIYSNLQPSGYSLSDGNTEGISKAVDTGKV